MIKFVLKNFKTGIRNYCVGMLKETANDKHTSKWAERLNLKLLYGIVFFFTVERVYFWWSDATLSALMTHPLVRPEQFALSLLIHYPQFLLWGIIAGLFAVLITNFIVGLWFGLATFLYRRMEQTMAVTSETAKSEVPND